MEHQTISGIDFLLIGGDAAFFLPSQYNSELNERFFVFGKIMQINALLIGHL